MLEQRKMEAMHFTFKQISTFFTEVFKRLVPAGRAKLVLKTVDHEEGHEIGPDDKNADTFTGLHPIWDSTQKLTQNNVFFRYWHQDIVY